MKRKTGDRAVSNLVRRKNEFLFSLAQQAVNNYPVASYFERRKKSYHLTLLAAINLKNPTPADIDTLIQIAGIPETSWVNLQNKKRPFIEPHETNQTSTAM